MTDYDGFEDPTPRVSAFASADSFRGRLILIEPTQVERNVPKEAANPTGARGDRVTANVTVVDGLGKVEIFSQKVPTGQYLEGPVHRKVWFNQDQITGGLQTPEGQLRKRVLCRIDTLKPGTSAGRGNPWTMTVTTPAEKAQAAAFIAQMIVNPAEDEDPFAKKPPF